MEATAMSKLRTMLVALGATLLLGAVPMASAGAEGPVAAGPEGTEWRLVTVTVMGQPMEVAADVTATLLLEDSEASGSAGCNRFFGGYVLDGELLGFGPVSSTRMFCEGAAQQVEDVYLPALEEVVYWAIPQDGRLHLLDADRADLLVYEPASPGIEGLTWVLREQSVDGALAPLPQGVVAFIELQGGSAGGNAGCNSYFAGYVIDGQAITFDRIGSTMMACEDERMSVESAYLANLETVAAWASDGLTLTFSAANGSAILVYDALAAGSIVGDWVVTTIAVGVDAVASSDTMNVITASFDASGQVSGFDGCNDYSASYEVDQDLISIGPLATTMMACADADTSSLAAAYAIALQGATRWQVTAGGSLELQGPDGNLLVAYGPATATKG
jgi:heat shock protein HslJ